MRSKFLIVLLFVSILSACTSINDKPVESNTASQSIDSRNKQVSQLTRWTINGKIAFINNQARQSATLHWQKNEAKKTESLRKIIPTATFTNIRCDTQHLLSHTHEKNLLSKPCQTQPPYPNPIQYEFQLAPLPSCHALQDNPASDHRHEPPQNH